MFSLFHEIESFTIALTEIHKNSASQDSIS